MWQSFILKLANPIMKLADCDLFLFRGTGKQNTSLAR